MSQQFDWIPFFNELAHQLLGYEQRQEELVQILARAGVENGLVDRMAEGGDPEPATEMDPLTFFAMINKYSSSDKRRAILQSVKDQMGIKAPVPTSFDGVPTANPMSARYVYWEYERDPSNIPTLWELVRAALKGEVADDLLRRSVAVPGTGVSKLTQGLYWVDATRYFPFDTKTKLALGRHFPDLPLDKFPGDYLKALESTASERQSDPEFNARMSKEGHDELVITKASAKEPRGDYDSGTTTLRTMFPTVEDALPHFQYMRHCLNVAGVVDKDAKVLSLNLTLHHGARLLRLNIYNASMYAVQTKYGELKYVKITASKGAEEVLGECDSKFSEVNGYSAEMWKLTPDQLDLIEQVQEEIDEASRRLGGPYSKYRKSPLRERYHQQRIMDAVFDHSLIEALLDIPLILKSEGDSEDVLATDDPLVESRSESNSRPQGSLNTILYGPPGTGKTYSTRSRALRIIDGIVPLDESEQQTRYLDLLRSGQLRFVTFHQSYAYEEFVEGIRPRIDPETSSVEYAVEDGILKKIAAAAEEEWKKSQSSVVNDPLQGLDRTSVQFWKFSLGQAGVSTDSEVYPWCIEEGLVALGYGQSVDLTDARTREEADVLLQPVLPKKAIRDYITRMMFDVQEGDIVLVPDGLTTIRAIGKVVGGYEYRDDAPQGYEHTRRVDWIVKDEILPSSLFYEGQLVPPAFRKLVPSKVVKEPVRTQPTTPKNYVLIIDEINRGNISNILGELITLLEADKRQGRENEIQVELPYSKKRFSLPPNLHILGTMNTADRSIALVDIALRRRFDFEELMPRPELLKTVDGINLPEFLQCVNDRLEVLYDRDHTIGHASFKSCESFEDIVNALRHKVIPLLQEYFYDDLRQVSYVFLDHTKPFEHQIIQEEVLDEINLFGEDLDGVQSRSRFTINKEITREGLMMVYQ